MPTRFGGSTVARSEVQSPDCDDDDDTDGDVIRNTQAALRHAIAGGAPDSIVDSAFQVFYDAYTPTIRRYASRLGARPQDLDDCVQNVLVRVIKKLPPFQRSGAGSFRRWLFLLVHSETRDHSRHCSRHPTRSLSEIEGTERDRSIHASTQRSRANKRLRSNWFTYACRNFEGKCRRRTLKWCGCAGLWV